MVFVSHETYTPARGGSASAEIHALRGVFGDAADRIVIANTKGFTGHAMGTGIEDVVAVKALETGCVPPVANFKEVDPELGVLNLSRGGAYPLEYALRLGAGFGSQISMTLMRRIALRRGASISQRLGLQLSHRRSSRVAGLARPDLGPCGGPGGGPSHSSCARYRRARQGGASRDKLRRSRAECRPAAPTVARRNPRKLRRRTDPVKERILALVVEKTGYPPDMLDLDLDLEADLGVDTVKQAEMFAAIRETYNIPRDPNLKLRDFPTLARVIQFVYDRRPDLKAAAAPRASRAAPVTAARRAAGRRLRAAEGARPDRGEDRLSQRHAGSGSRSGSRPRRRYRQTGRDVRGHPRDLQHPARPESEAARFPDIGARHPVRV